MRLFGVPGENAGDRTVASQRNVHHKIVPRHARDFQQFTVQRVILDRAFRRATVAHEPGAVQDFDGFLGRQAGGDQFPPAGESKHKVGLDEAERDVQARRHESLIDVYGGARRRRSQMPV